MTIVREQMEAIDEAILNKNFVHATLKFENILKGQKPLKPKTPIYGDMESENEVNAYINARAKKVFNKTAYDMLSKMGIDKNKPIDYFKYAKGTVKMEKNMIFPTDDYILGLYDLLVKVSNEVDKYCDKVCKNPKKYYDPAEFERAYKKIDNYVRLQLIFKVQQLFSFSKKSVNDMLKVADDSHIYHRLFNLDDKTNSAISVHVKNVSFNTQDELVKIYPLYKKYIDISYANTNKYFDIVDANRFSGEVKTDEECVKKLRANIMSINARLWNSYTKLLDTLRAKSINTINTLIGIVSTELNNMSSKEKM